MKSTNPNLFGKLDDARRQRLLELDQLFRSNTEERLTLRWPDEFQTRTALNDFSLEGPATLNLFSSQLRDFSRIMRMGATSISHPRFETVTAPIVDRSLKAGWGDSTDLDNVPLSVADAEPRRVSCFITLSDQLRLQNPLLAGRFIEAQLLSAISSAIDDAVVNGSGSNGEPLGILADATLPKHERASAGVNAEADLVAMEKAIADSHGEHDPEDFLWILASDTRAALRQLGGTSDPIFRATGNGPLGYRAAVLPTAPNGTAILCQASQLGVFDWQRLEIENLHDVQQAKAGFRTMFATAWIDFCVLDSNSIVVAVNS